AVDRSTISILLAITSTTTRLNVSIPCSSKSPMLRLSLAVAKTLRPRRWNSQANEWPIPPGEQLERPCQRTPLHISSGRGTVEAHCVRTTKPLAFFSNLPGDQHGLAIVGRT